jgi:hypothetical protein
VPALAPITDVADLRNPGDISCPLTRSVFWGPMAVAIMGGLIVATALTLLSLPAMYAAWFRVQEPAR